MWVNVITNQRQADRSHCLGIANNITIDCQFYLRNKQGKQTEKFAGLVIRLSWRSLATVSAVLSSTSAVVVCCPAVLQFGNLHCLASNDRTTDWESGWPVMGLISTSVAGSGLYSTYCILQCTESWNSRGKDRCEDNMLDARQLSLWRFHHERRLGYACS